MIQNNDAPGAYACLAACYGHLGQIEAAREALHRYGELSGQPIEVFASSVFHAPAHIKLFLDGIALAEGKSPSDSPAGGYPAPVDCLLRVDSGPRLLGGKQTFTRAPVPSILAEAQGTRAMAPRTVRSAWSAR